MRVANWHPENITIAIEKKAMDRLEIAANLVAMAARGYVHVQTGKLKESIRVVRLHGDPKQNVRVYAGNRKKGGPYYSHMVEYGTVKMSAKPFLRPGLSAVKGMVKGIVQNGK